jgi:Family of unknown function (DUF5947)
MGALASSRLRSLARGGPAPAPSEPAADAAERCELCGLPIPEAHRHLIDLERGGLMCACQACSTLFNGAAAGGGHFKLVPDRRLRVDLDLPDAVWEQLCIPVEMAYFFRSSREERIKAFYPSPMGPTESLLGLEAWDELEERNPVIRGLSDDVEALLVNRARGARRSWIVPIEDCFCLVAVIRTRWRGFSGGAEVWDAIDRFYDDLDSRSKASTGKEPTWQR